MTATTQSGHFEMNRPTAFLLSVAIVTTLMPWIVEGEFTFNTLKFLPMILIVVCIFTVFTVWPAYYFLKKKNMLTWYSLAIAGFICAFISYAVFEPTSLGAYRDLKSEGVFYIERGSYTKAGWFRLLNRCVFTGLAGALGGLSFWLMIKNSVIKNVR